MADLEAIILFQNVMLPRNRSNDLKYKIYYGNQKMFINNHNKTSYIALTRKQYRDF